MPLVRVLVLMPCKGNKTILDKLYGSKMYCKM